MATLEANTETLDSAVIPVETVALIVYSGEPDEIKRMDVIDIAGAEEKTIVGETQDG